MSRFARRLQQAQPATGTPASELYGWQLTAANVGLASLGIDRDSLPIYTGSNRPARGTTISDMHITEPLDLSLGDITIQRCLFRPISVGQGLPAITTTDFNTFIDVPGPVTIRDCELDGSLLTQFLAAMSCGFLGIGNLINNYVHGFGSGIAEYMTGTQFDALVEHNYVTSLVAWGDPATDGNHSDGFTVRDFSAASEPSRQLIVRNNRIDCSSGNDTGAFFIQTYGGRIDNVLAQGNLLEGSGYNLGVNELNYPYSNIQAINNRFNPSGFGAGYVQGGPGWALQQENYLYNAANPDGKGTPVSF